MNWINIDSADKINEIKELSEKERVLIFKCSPQNAVDHVIKTLLEREWHDGEMKMKTYLVNVNDNKELSDKIAVEFSAEHLSPQVLIVEKGKCVFNTSYGKILFSEIRKFAN